MNTRILKTLCYINMIGYSILAGLAVYVEDIRCMKMAFIILCCLIVINSVSNLFRARQKEAMENEQKRNNKEIRR